MRTGKVSPKELVQAAIRRIEAVNPKLNAVVWKRFDQALADAEAKDLPDGPFRGVPILKKDSGLATAGEPDWEASKFLQSADYRSKETGVFAERITKAGFISLGHSNTPEFAAQGTTEPALYGPTRNPWNAEHSAGGSSGGAGCAVASGMVPVAQTTDGAGSTRIPASANGVVGLKPSRGRITYAPSRTHWFDLSTTYGFITRTIRDLAGCMDFAQGPALGDTLVPMPPARPYMEEIAIAPKRLRIGLWTAPPKALPLPIHPECVKAAEETARLSHFTWPHRRTGASRGVVAGTGAAGGRRRDPDRSFGADDRQRCGARPVGARAHRVELVVGGRDGRTLAVARQSRAVDIRLGPGSERVTIDEFFARVREMLIGRVSGPLTFRLILQPIVAAIFAVRAGLRDAREGRPPFFFWAIFTNPVRRPELLAQVRKDVCRVFIMAVVLDVIYELIVYRWVYPGQAVIVAAVLAILPYLLICGPVTRIMRRFQRP